MATKQFYKQSQNHRMRPKPGDGTQVERCPERDNNYTGPWPTPQEEFMDDGIGPETSSDKSPRMQSPEAATESEKSRPRSPMPPLRDRREPDVQR